MDTSTPAEIGPATAKLECRRVWKIFGARSAEALAAAKAGAHRSEIYEQFECVIAVADVSFAVQAGEIFCIMGLSGSGKSTLVRHINRLIDPSEGQVLLDGEDIGSKTPDQIRELRATKIGMVFQNMALFPHRTVRDNVAFGLEIRGMGKEARDEIAEGKLELVQLSGWGDRLPHELSGGMQQRVGLARALAVDPDILLMDEPFSALDPLIRRQLQDEFLALSSQLRKTTVFITHDLDEANRLGDRIGIMRDGRIIQIGSPEQISIAPADEYVAEFVSGLSHWKIVQARNVMEALPPNITAGASPADWPFVWENTGLTELVRLSTQQENPILVMGNQGNPMGIITRKSLLRAMFRRELQ